MDIFATLDSLVLPLAAMGFGIYLLVKGGDFTIDGAVFTARRFGLSPLVVGFTIVAFGTSLPELIVSVFANLQGSPGIALGNVLGSNIANILLVIGMTSIFATLHTTSKGLRRDLIMMMGTTILMGVILYYGAIPRLFGLGMILLLLMYVLFQYKMAKKGEIPLDEPDEPEFNSSLGAYLALLGGLVLIALGAEFLVRGAKVSAEILGVPEAVIALSIIALGTSLPELSTCIIAGRKGHSDIVLGNIIGSNVFNILMIIGLTALVKPIAAGTFAAQLVDFDIWVVGLVSLIFTVLVFAFSTINRVVGGVFVFAYVLYNIYIYAIYFNG